MGVRPVSRNASVEPIETSSRTPAALVTCQVDSCQVKGIYKLAKKYGIKLAWGSDTLFAPELATKQGKKLAKMQRWFTPYEVLKMATHDNAQLLGLAGERSPYRGEIGVIREGALADLIMVDGNPLEDLNLVADPENRFVVIMKDGVLHKNILP